MQLRDYQIKISGQGLAILKQYGLLCLAMEARCGKTLTSLNIANGHGAKKVLFTTKKKAIGSIKKDYENLKPGYDLFVCNYEQLHNINPDDFDFIIADECHSLSAFPKPSKCTQLLKKIAEGKPVIFLSGTFTPESYSQIYHILYVSSCSPFKEYVNFYKWANDGFVKIKKKMINGIPFNDYKAANKEKIDQFTKHLFITFSQKDAGFMQEVQEEILTVKMKSQTYWLANKLLRDRVHIGKGGEEIIADTGVKLQNKLHQIFSGSVIDEKGNAIAFDDTKARFIAERFAGKKIAIFYIFRAELEMLRWVFKGRITDSPEEFNNSSDLVFCSQIQSGSMGTNLSTAQALVFYNIHFSNLQYWQARERMQLQKRETPALLYWVFSEGGIETKIYDAVAQKKDYVISYFRKDFLVTELKNIA